MDSKRSRSNKTAKFFWYFSSGSLFEFEILITTLNSLVFRRQIQWKFESDVEIINLHKLQIFSIKNISSHAAFESNIDLIVCAKYMFSVSNSPMIKKIFK